MARITWQNVDAPNVSSSIEGMKVASDLLGRGLGAARQGITDVVDAKTLAASNAAMAQLLQFQKPEEVQAAVAAGQIAPGVDPRYLNKDAMGMMAGRANDLMAQETGQIKLGQTRQGNTDFQLLNSPEGRTAINELRMAENSRDPAMISAAREKHANFLLSASPDALNALTKEGQNIGSQDLNYLVSKTAFDNGETDRDVVNGSLKLFNKAVKLSGGADYGEEYLNTNEAALIEEFGGGERGQRIFDNTMKTFMNGTGGGAGAADAAMGGALGGGMGAGGAETKDVVLGAGQGPNGSNKYGIVPPKPISTMTMGELYNFQRNEMLPKTRAAGVGKDRNGKVVGSSAAGTYQIVSTTLAEAAPKVLGANWQSMPFSDENQEKIGRYLFERRKVGEDLHNEWEGLPPGTIKTAGMDWNSIRNTIIQKESGGRGSVPQSRLADPRASAVATQMAIKHSISENDVIPLAVDLEAAWQNMGTADSVAKALTGSGQAFEGDNSNGILGQITSAMKTYGIKNAAVMGQILARSKDGQQSPWAEMVDGKFNPFSDHIKANIDWKKVENLSNFAKDRGAMSTLAVNTDRQQRSMTQVTAGQSAVEALTLQMQSAMSEARSKGRSTAGIERRYNQLLGDAIGRRDNAVVGSRASATAGDTAPAAPRRPATASVRSAAPAAKPAPTTPTEIMAELKPNKLDENEIQQGLAQGRFANIVRKSGESDRDYASRVLINRFKPAYKPTFRKSGMSVAEQNLLDEVRRGADRSGGFGGS